MTLDWPPDQPRTPPEERESWNRYEVICQNPRCPGHEEATVKRNPGQPPGTIVGGPEG